MIAKLRTHSPAGRAMFQMLGVFAEFERSIIQQRVRAGIATARSRGTKSGRPFGRPCISSVREDEIRKLLEQGMGIRGVARLVGAGNGVVAKIRKQIQSDQLN